MAKKKDTKNALLLGGIAAAAVGGYLLLRKATGPQAEVLVQYYVDADRAAAELIHSKLNTRHLIKGYVDPNNIILPLVAVGGSLANPTSSQLHNFLQIPDLSEADAGHGYIYARTYSGIRVWIVEGWNQEDTMAAASFIANAGSLPTQDLVI